MIYLLRDIERDGPSGSIADSVLIIRMKARRNGLLNQSDWTQLPDNPISNKAAYATWRHNRHNTQSKDTSSTRKASKHKSYSLRIIRKDKVAPHLNRVGGFFIF